jgi:hypothetical protein
MNFFFKLPLLVVTIKKGVAERLTAKVEQGPRVASNKWY